PRTIISRCCLKSNDSGPFSTVDENRHAQLDHKVVVSCRADARGSGRVWLERDSGGLLRAGRRTTGSSDGALSACDTLSLCGGLWVDLSPLAVEAMVAAKKRGVDVRL